MKTSSAKGKGRRLQKLIADKLTEITGIPNGPDEMIFSRPMGQSGSDIGIVGALKKRIGFAFECKNQEKFSMHAWIRQAVKNETDEMPWCLVVSRNRFSPFVSMKSSTLKNLISFKTKIRTNKFLKVYKYSQKTWKMPEWVLKARETNDQWGILTKTDNIRVMTVDLDLFLNLLKCKYDKMSNENLQNEDA